MTKEKPRLVSPELMQELHDCLSLYQYEPIDSELWSDISAALMGSLCTSMNCCEAQHFPELDRLDLIEDICDESTNPIIEIQRGTVSGYVVFSREGRAEVLLWSMRGGEVPGSIVVGASWNTADPARSDVYFRRRRQRAKGQDIPFDARVDRLV